MTRDVIVLGAGLNGLVVATMLAKRGRSVTLLERRPVVGGSVASEEIRPGFRVDRCLHDAGWLSPSIAGDLDLARHGLSYLPDSGGICSLLGDGDYLAIRPGKAHAADAIRRFSSADSAAWTRFSEAAAGIAAFLELLYAESPPRIDADSTAEFVAMLGLGRRFRRLGRQRMVELLRWLPMSVAELLDDHFESETLKGVVGSRGITRIMQGPRSGATAFHFLHHLVGRPADRVLASPLPAGGAGGVARALASAAIAAGVDIRTGAEVGKVRTDGLRAKGVALRTGEELEARAVVSTIDPRTTFLSLCDPTRLEPSFVKAVRNIRYRGAWAKVNLALDALPRFGGPKAEDAHLRGSMVIAPTIDYLERAYDDAKYGRVSADPYVEIRIPSLADPSLAPPGKHVMSVAVQYTPYHRRDGAWDAAARDALGAAIMKTLAAHAPGIESLVLERQVLTPADLEEQFGLPEGNAADGEMMLDQILFMRPVAGWSRYRTPISGLYYCGSGAHPGGGIAGGAGAIAAREILRDA